LKDTIPLGVALPHRSPEPIEAGAVRLVAQRAEALGFRDLWVTENTLDHVFCFDPVVVLTYAAAVTTTIRLGASVVVLPVHHPALIAHQWASLDHLSGGRAILGSAVTTITTSSRCPESAGCGASARRSS
jgi:alkanesulfonate monooxygenase SsuD/methylene tetrahydromethanopterin reductase-like flavin-dependent oxidoreductase (luciferase family)